jgi:hypothetical protein
VFTKFHPDTTPNQLPGIRPFPLASLKPGAKVTGTTIAELGNRNRPLDMIVYQKGGQDYLLMANNSRGVMKIPTAAFAAAQALPPAWSPRRAVSVSSRFRP